MSQPGTSYRRRQRGGEVAKTEYVPKVTNWFPRDVDNAGGTYSLVADQGMWELATDPWLPVNTRLLCAAMARANRYGHASFRRGELRAILSGAKGNPCAENTLKDNLHKLVSGQAVAPDSTPLCVVLASNAFRRGSRSIVTCKESAHTGRELSHWVKGLGWETAPGSYQDMLDQGNGLAMQAIANGSKVTIETETITRSRTTIEPAAAPQWTGPAPGRCPRGACPEMAMPGFVFCEVHQAEVRAEASRPATIQGVAEPVSPRCSRDDCDGYDSGDGHCWAHRSESGEPEARPVRIFGSQRQYEDASGF